MLRFAVCLLVACLAFLAPADAPVQRGLFLFLLVAGLWLSEAIHITVTALLVPVLAVLSGLLEPKQALAAFADPIIALFFGGFVLASALHRHGIDAWIAARVVSLARGRLVPAALLLFAVTTFISLWVSNTAAAAMMLPLALGLLAGMDPQRDRQTFLFVLLGIGWAASLGGMGTLVGSPPNALAGAAAGIDFRDWFAYGLPAMLLLAPLGALVLWLLWRPRNVEVAITTQRLAWTRGATASLVVFALTVAAWLASAPLGAWLGVDKDMDSIIAVAAAVALLATGTLAWKDVERDVEWGVLLLFGGGLCLGAVLKASGLSDWLATRLLAGIGGLPLVVVLLALATFIVFLSELASNTAATALLLPLFLPLAPTLGIPDAQFAAFIALTASCGFMLPVATPPNAIVFGSGHIRQRDMMRAGFVMNLACIVTLTLLFL